MSHVQPKTQINLCYTVPIDAEYNHTIYFKSEAAQKKFFQSRTIFTLNNQSYQRLNSNKMRVELTQSQCEQCNYLWFKNEGYTDGTTQDIYKEKIIYCFIVACEYINDTTTEITYEMDVIQTWFFDVRYQSCLVDRIHMPYDGPQYLDVRTPEDFSEPVTYTEFVVTSPNFKELVPAVFTTLDINGDKQSNSLMPDSYFGMTINGIPTGAQLMVFPKQKGGTGPDRNDYEYVDEFLKKVSEKGTTDGIISMYMVPKKFIGNNLSSTGNNNRYGMYTGSLDAGGDNVITIPSYNLDFDGYTPRNKKLYTYPYKKLSVYSFSTGQKQEYKYEWFANGLKFREYCSLVGNVEGLTVPVSYRRMSNDYSRSVSINNFPTCGYSIDSYKAWLAQNANSIEYQREAQNTKSSYNLLSKMVSGAVAGATGAGAVGALVGSAVGPAGTAAGAAAGALAGSVIGGVGSAVKSVFVDQKLLESEIEATMKDRATKADAGLGSNQTSVITALSLNTFMYEGETIDWLTAVRLDDYFTRYGYKYARISGIVRMTRQNYTYLKTVDCKVSGPMPATDQVAIQSIHNKGITYWMDPFSVGMYSISNEPLGSWDKCLR